jgi:hypothetical protein
MILNGERKRFGFREPRASDRRYRWGREGEAASEQTLEMLDKRVRTPGSPEAAWRSTGIHVNQRWVPNYDYLALIEGASGRRPSMLLL